MFAAAGIGTVRRGRGGVNEVDCLRRGDIAFFSRDHQVFGSRVKEAGKLEIRFLGSQGDQGRKCSIIVMRVDPARRERGGVGNKETKEYLRSCR